MQIEKQEGVYSFVAHSSQHALQGTGTASRLVMKQRRRETAQVPELVSVGRTGKHSKQA